MTRDYPSWQEYWGLRDDEIEVSRWAFGKDLVAEGLVQVGDCVEFRFAARNDYHRGRVLVAEDSPTYYNQHVMIETVGHGLVGSAWGIINIRVVKRSAPSVPRVPLAPGYYPKRPNTRSTP